MGIDAWLAVSQGTAADALLAGVNGRLTACRLSITREDVQELARRRAASLIETERVEFGEPAILTIAEAVAGSPWLSQDNAADCLVALQDAFYVLRDELPADVPDAEIAEALRGCLDAWEDAATVASLQVEEVMGFSREYVRASEAEANGAYRITDDDGRTYSFDLQEWAYDEQTDGWDGERWTDDGND